MATIGTLLRQAREAGGLSLDSLAAWSRLSTDLLRAAEDGTGRLTAEEVDRCARVFGLRLEDLLAGEAGRAPMTMLLRGETVLAQDMRGVLTAEIDEALGEFQRVVRDIADIERLLGEDRPEMPRIDASRCPLGRHIGEHRARRLREELRLAASPIRSMSKLAEQLGVRVVWATHEQVDKEVDGACTTAPRPAILVNIPEAGNLYPWRVRATIAHELGHLLFDLTPGTPVAVSLDQHKRQPKHLDEIEQNARAFAACLLAPAEGVRLIVGALDPSSDAAIELVGITFGVGRTLAINRLQKVFSLTDDERTRMTRRAPRAYSGDFGEDQAPCVTGFRGEPLLGLLHRALARGLASPSRARRILGLSAFEALPFDDLGELSAPILTEQHAIARKAAVYLTEQQIPATPGEPTLIEGEWHVPLSESRFGPGEQRSMGILVLDRRGEATRLLRPERDGER